MSDELKAAAERNMSSYYERMIDTTVTHGMLIFCDHRKAHELAREADAENEGLRKIVDRLPKTADGVPVICDGMTIFCPKGHENKLSHATGRLYCTGDECWDDGCQGDSGSGTYYPLGKCYAAIDAAIERKDQP